MSLHFSIGITSVFLSLLVGGSFAAAQYSDVDPEADYAPAVQSLSEKGALEGYADGTFRPRQLMNRAEYLKTLMISVGQSSASDSIRCFDDFRGEEVWFWSYACSAREHGIISGYPDGTFRGWKTINLAEALKIAVNAYQLPVPQYIRAPDHWYDPYIIVANEYRLFITVDDDPAHLVTRAEMAVIINAFAGGHNCLSTNQCPAGYRCSTERGECRPSCPPGADMCTQVCSGVCEIREPVCGNGICEDSEGYWCPACTKSTPPCMAPCQSGTCQRDCQ